MFVPKFVVTKKVDPVLCKNAKKLFMYYSFMILFWHVLFKMHTSFRAGPSRQEMKSHYRAEHLALWTWLIPALERVGSRHGPNSTFHRFADGPTTFYGPIRPNTFFMPHHTTTVLPQTQLLKNNTNLLTNNTDRVIHDASVTDRYGYSSSKSIFGDEKLGNIPYTTALTITGALAATLILLSIVVLAAMHYRKNSQHKLQPTCQPSGPSPSHCGTIHSSTTLRSLNCPQDWPPEYSTCFPETSSQQEVKQCTKNSNHHHVLNEILEQEPPVILNDVTDTERISRQTQHYQVHNTPISCIDANNQQLVHQRTPLLNQNASVHTYPDNQQLNHFKERDCSSFRQRKIINGSSTLQMVRRPPAPERPSSVPPPQDPTPSEPRSLV